MSEIKNKIEAILFSCGGKIPIEEISKLTGYSKNVILKTLNELKQLYEDSDNSLKIIEEGDQWKMSVKEKYISLVRSIVTETDLPKSILETLAVIAWKAPMLQSDLIKIRNNKAYEHIKELLESGFISKERSGRSYKIKLAQKFFDYFDIDSIKKIRKDLNKTAESVPKLENKKEDIDNDEMDS